MFGLVYSRDVLPAAWIFLHHQAWWRSSAGSASSLSSSIFPITKDSEATLRFADRGQRRRPLERRLLRRVVVDNGPHQWVSRLLQVRLATPSGGKVKPVGRPVAMSLAMVPLPWGYLPIPLKRLGFPDWLAHTRVIEN